MKKAITGMGFMVMGALLVAAATIPAGFIATDITEWWSNLGKFGTALVDNMFLIVLFAVGILFMAVGIVVAIRAMSSREHEYAYEEEEEETMDYAPEPAPVHRGMVARREYKQKEFEEFELGDLEIEKPEDEEE